MDQMVKNLPVMQETWVQTLVWEDSQEKGMATHSSILVGRISWTEGPGAFLGTQILLSGPQKVCSSKGAEKKPGGMLPWGNMLFLTCPSEPHSFVTASGFAL